MKLRPASSHLAEHFQRPLRFGRFWRGHELPLRIVQLALMVMVAWFGAQLIFFGVSLVPRMFAS